MGFCNNCGHSNIVHKHNKYRCDVPNCKCREFETKIKKYKYQLSPVLYPSGKINGINDLKRIEIYNKIKNLR